MFDMPREFQNSVGQIVLDYTKAIQESVFEQMCVVREGHLRIVFNQDLKVICSPVETFFANYSDIVWCSHELGSGLKQFLYSFIILFESQFKVHYSPY
jgi:hypothetical protein